MQKYRKHIPVILLLITSLLIGIITLKDYGESWDEADIYRYGDYAINAYRYILHPQDLPSFNTNLNLYGPAYYLGTDLIARFVIKVIPTWSQVNGWHFIYFLTFLVCALLIYLLSLRWMSELSAFGVVLLFLSQPLLWGHAFINPKDIPFTTFFTACIYTGLIMVDRYKSSLKLDGTFISAGILLGLTGSFRVIGPLAGVLVLGYAIYKLRSKAVYPVLPYLVIGAITTYLTWPYLWGSFVAHYLDSLNTMSQFPFATNILFKGKLFKANQLPNTYFPTMLGIQLTEPALVLIGLGVLISMVQFYKKQSVEPLLLFLAWFLIPASLIIGTGTPLYDNARQLYFLFPPLFILTGLALEKIFIFLTNPVVKALLLLIIALPSIYVATRLHPYEYVYYNALVGGTGGAYRKFELDYWGISFKEITEYINSTLPEKARVLVYGPEQTIRQYARPDLQVFIPEEQPATTYDYVAFLTRENLDERRCKGAEIIYSIERRGAILSDLKRIPPEIDCR